MNTPYATRQNDNADFATVARLVKCYHRGILTGPETFARLFDLFAYRAVAYLAPTRVDVALVHVIDDFNPDATDGFTARN